MSIANQAKNLAIGRELNGESRGVRLEDLNAALSDTIAQTAALTALLPPEALARDLGINCVASGVVRDPSYS